MSLREVCIQFNLLGLQQKAEEGVHCVSVSQEYPLRAAFEVPSISIDKL
jgi:hypothetical protein